MIKKIVYALMFVVSFILPASTVLAGDTIYNGAKNMSGQEMLGVATNTAAAASLWGQCSWKHNPAPCIMAIITGAQAAQTASGAGKTSNIGDITDWQSYGDGHNNVDIGCWADNSCDSGDPFAGLNPNDPAPPPYGTVGGLISELERQKKLIQKSGAKIDMDKQVVTDPEGNEVPFSQASAGMDSSQLAKLKADSAAYVKKHMKDASKYSVSGVGLASGGGGGGSSLSFDSYEPDSSLADYLKQLRGKGKRGPSSVAGLKKIVDGEPIGVAADDIFKMVHRRYQEKRSKKIFLEKQ